MPSAQSLVCNRVRPEVGAVSTARCTRDGGTASAHGASAPAWDSDRTLATRRGILDIPITYYVQRWHTPLPSGQVLEHFFAKYQLESPLQQYLLRRRDRLDQEVQAVMRELQPTLSLKSALDTEVSSARCVRLGVSNP